jgi:hypothetical protein
MFIEMLIVRGASLLEAVRGQLVLPGGGLQAVAIQHGVTFMDWASTVRFPVFHEHSLLTLTADALEVNIVDASGNTKTLNQYTDKDHFWVIRGGAGNSWGIITSITYKTHPLPTHINTVFAQYLTNDTTGRRAVIGRVLQALPAITDAGYTGYGTLAPDVGLIFIQPNGTKTTSSEVTKLLNEIGNVDGVMKQVGAFDFPSWIEYCNAFLHDPNIATNIIDPSRLLTAEVLTNKTEKLLDALEDFPELEAGFNFIGKVNSQLRDQTSVHNIWKESRAILSMGANWADEAPEKEKRRMKLLAVEASRRLAQIVGRNGGTYVNEANPYEPLWKEAFWGEKYDRLERIKRKVDPKGVLICNRCVGGEIVYEP